MVYHATPRFVEAGRKDQLQRLLEIMRLAVQKGPQAVIVEGEAGIGKTWLVREFCRLAEQEHSKLLVACGECSELLGKGDPYLPFKDILGLLLGEFSGKRTDKLVVDQVNARRLRSAVATSAEIMLDLGGDLLGVLVPGAKLISLLMEVGAVILDKGLTPKLNMTSKPAMDEEAKPDRLFEQYGRVLVRISESQPLLLVIEDLHWADESTLALLFYVLRRLFSQQDCPVCLVVTTRPIETEHTSQEKAFSKTVSELKRYGMTRVDLSETSGDDCGRAFVDDIIDQEPNRLDYAFRQLITERTEGHPLFAVELLNYLKDQGILAKNGAGEWYLAQPMSLSELPEKVEAVVAARIEGLESDLKDILRCGSVEGEEFTAEVVARVQDINERRLIMRMSEELDRQAHLIKESEALLVNRQRLHRHQFRHSLFQHFCYNHLSSFEREMLHGEVGETLEALYGGEADTIAAQLARHFELGQVPDKAARYFRIAADRALSAFANENAVALYGDALRLLAQGSGDAEAEFEILAGREAAYHHLGQRTEQRRDLEAMLALAERQQQLEWIAVSKLRKARFFEKTSEFVKAIAWSRATIEAAQLAQKKRLECEGYLCLSWAQYWSSAYEDAIESAQAAAKVARAVSNSSLEARALSIQGLAWREVGDYEKAHDCLAPALQLSEAAADRTCQADVLDNLGIVLGDQGYFQQAVGNRQRALKVARDLGDRWLELDILDGLLNDVIRAGELQAALDLGVQALDLARAIENHWAETDLMLTLADAYLFLGDYFTSKHWLDDAKTPAEGSEDEDMLGWWNIGMSDLCRETRQGVLAKAHAEEAVDIFRRKRDTPRMGVALDVLGHACLTTGDLVEAGQAYRQAIDLLPPRDHLISQCRAKLARIEIILGHEAEATTLAEEVGTWIKANSLDRFVYPFEVVLDCAFVLQRVGRAEMIPKLVAEAHEILISRANQLTDPTLRQSYLNVTAHRDLRHLWQSLDRRQGS